MDPQLPVALEDYPSFVGYEPLPFIGAGGCSRLKTSDPARPPSEWLWLLC